MQHSSFCNHEAASVMPLENSDVGLQFHTFCYKRGDRLVCLIVAFKTFYNMMLAQFQGKKKTPYLYSDSGVGEGQNTHLLISLSSYKERGLFISEPL